MFCFSRIWAPVFHRTEYFILPSLQIKSELRGESVTRGGAKKRLTSSAYFKVNGHTRCQQADFHAGVADINLDANAPGNGKLCTPDFFTSTVLLFRQLYA